MNCVSMYRTFKWNMLTHEPVIICVIGYDPEVDNANCQRTEMSTNHAIVSRLDKGCSRSSVLGRCFSHDHERSS